LEGAPGPEAPAPTPTPAASAPASSPAPAAASGEFADNALVKKVQEFGLEHEVYSHAPCMTAEELVTNVPLASPKESHTKNLLLKDKKHGMFLVTHATSTTFNTKQLGNLLNLQGKVNLRLAANDLLEKHLQVKAGCVGPMCIINDSSKEVTLVLDKALMDYDYIHSHPLRNDASVKMTPAALNEFMSKAGIEPVVLDFSEGGGAAKGDGGGKAPANRPPGATEAPKPKKDKQQKPQQQPKQNKKTAKKGDTLLALQWKKFENFPMWYSDVIVLSEMISYYDISGCYILRPWSYKVWDLMQQWFNVEVGRRRMVCFSLFIGRTYRLQTLDFRSF
jgi:prolyl-tRNA synthetase